MAEKDLFEKLVLHHPEQDFPRRQAMQASCRYGYVSKSPFSAPIYRELQSEIGTPDIRSTIVLEAAYSLVHIVLFAGNEPSTERKDGRTEMTYLSKPMTQICTCQRPIRTILGVADKQLVQLFNLEIFENQP